MARVGQAAPALAAAGMWLLGFVVLISCRAATSSSGPGATAPMLTVEAAQGATDESGFPTAVIVSSATVPPVSAVTAEATSPTVSDSGALDAEAAPANADVQYVRAVETSAGVWTFHVTVAHPDTGWEDYADGWDVVLPDGRVIKPDAEASFTRLLLHPHETEQPFTRSQSGIEIQADVTSVLVRAHDLIAGFGGQEVVVEFSMVSGLNFEVQRLP